MQRRAADLGGQRRDHALERGGVVGAHVADELAGAGDDVERVAGVHDGRHGGQVVGAVGVVAAGDRLGGGGEREQRVAPAVGGRAGVGGAAACVDAQRAGGLAAHDDALLAVGVARAALEAQARVPAREALGVAERGGPPLLVAHEQERDLGVVLRPRGERAQDAEREHDAALHVDRAGADRASRRRARAAGGRRGRSRCRGGRAAGSGPRRCRPGARSGRRRGRGRSTGRARARRRRASARRTPRRTPRRRGGRRRGRRRPRAPPARAARGGRSPASTWRPSRPSGGQRYPATVYGRCPSCPRWRSPPAA